MRRLIPFLIAAALAALALTPAAASAKTCSHGYTHATIDHAQKCLRRGSAAASSPTKARYIAKADMICKAGNARTERISASLKGVKLTTASGVAKEVAGLNKAVQIDHAGLVKLRALPMPNGDVTILTKLWNTFGQVLLDQKAVAAAIDRLKGSKANQLSAKASIADAKYKGLAEGFGFRYCGAQ